MEDQADVDRHTERRSLPIPTVPAWVQTLVAADSSLCLIEERVDAALHMDLSTFQQHVAEAYRSIFRKLTVRAACHAVRFWAFVPGIHDQYSPVVNRYMAFNSARHSAYAEHLGAGSLLGQSTPTASAVGITGAQLLLYCLASETPGIPVENPRQTPAYKYSRRYGPLPPCFSRATRLPRSAAQPYLLVGGTASITGEDSRHQGCLDEQFFETCCNLAHLVSAAADRVVPESAPFEQLLPMLGAFRDVRVYHPDESHRSRLEQLTASVFLPRTRVEFVQATVCRAELLLEIEGFALPRSLV